LNASDHRRRPPTGAPSRRSARTSMNWLELVLRIVVDIELEKHHKALPTTTRTPPERLREDAYGRAGVWKSGISDLEGGIILVSEISREMFRTRQERSRIGPLRSSLIARMASTHYANYGCRCVSSQAHRRFASLIIKQSERKEANSGSGRLNRMRRRILSAPEIKTILARFIFPRPIARVFALSWSLWQPVHQARATAAHCRARQRLYRQLQ